MRRAAVVVAIALLGCQGGVDEGPRVVLDEHHVSVRELPGWEQGTERGSVVFRGPASEGLERTTILVRAVPRTGDWVEERTPELAVPATARYLKALPGAKLGAPEPLRRDGFAGAAFSLTFTPRSGEGQTYERRHVVLVGAERVVHIVHTAPAGQLGQSAAIFDDVIASVREEA